MGRASRQTRGWLVGGACCLALLLASTFVAADQEEPCLTVPLAGGATVVGGEVVITPDLGGPEIDAREALDPQITATLTMDDSEDSSENVLVVTIQPTNECQAE